MKLRDGEIVRAIAFVALASASAFLLFWIWNGKVEACEVGKTGEYLQKTFETLDATVNYVITWSVTIIGASAAILLGLKSGMRLTAWSKALLLIVSALFLQAAGAGVYWKLQLANSWLNRCLNLIYQPQVTRAFDGMLYFLTAGLILSFVLVCVAARTQASKGQQ